jgi:hypothetical protein
MSRYTSRRQSQYMKAYRSDPTVRERARTINQRSSMRSSLALAYVRANHPKIYAAICNQVDKERPL